MEGKQIETTAQSYSSERQRAGRVKKISESGFGPMTQPIRKINELMIENNEVNELTRQKQSWIEAIEEY